MVTFLVIVLLSALAAAVYWRWRMAAPGETPDRTRVIEEAPYMNRIKIDPIGFKPPKASRRALGAERARQRVIAYQAQRGVPASKLGNPETLTAKQRKRIKHKFHDVGCIAGDHEGPCTCITQRRGG